MPLLRSVDVSSAPERSRYLRLSLLAAGVIAFADWLLVPNFAIGFLYIFPIMLSAAFLKRWEILLLAAACTVLTIWRDAFSLSGWDSDVMPQAIAVLTVFSGAGLLTRELAQNRQKVLGHLAEVEQQVRLRQQAELQLKVLVESSPLGILIADWKGKILSANAAAHHMLGTADSSFDLELIDSFLPVLSKFQRKGMPTEPFRTELEAKGRRRSGQVFLAHLWLSTFKVGSETRLAVMVSDESQELRDREEAALRQLLWHSRLMMGAVAHEMRNLCGAIGIVHANLRRVAGIEQNEDFRALGELVEGLRAIVAAELRLASEGRIGKVELASVFENVRIVIEPSFREAGAEVEWKIPPELPAVWAEPQGLKQVFLNLCQNSCRVLETASQKLLTITASVEPKCVLVKLQDTGPGIADPERLFQPFQEGASMTGMGLYVSRAVIRGFGGKLQYEPTGPGACFAIELVRADQEAGTVA